MHGTPGVPEGYTRDLLREGGRVRIQSKCNYCGLVIFGSMPEMAEQEKEHRDGCKKPARAKRRSWIEPITRRHERGDA